MGFRSLDAQELGSGADFFQKASTPDDILRFWVTGESFPRMVIRPSVPEIRTGNGTVFPVTPFGGGGGTVDPRDLEPGGSTPIFWDTVIHIRGTLGARPAAGATNQGSLYSASDNGILYRSTGAIWEAIASLSGAVSSVNAQTGAVVLTATDIGLSNVTNDAQLKASQLDTDGTLTANSDAKVASQKATKTYVDALSTATGIALALKAPIASPTFTGTVTIPNGAVLGTPASVNLTNGTSLPESGVTGLVADLAAKAPIASPTFTGTVTIPNGGVLGTPASINLTNGTALPEAGVTGLVADLAAKLVKASNLSDVASAPSSRYNLHDQQLAGAVVVATANLSLTGAATIDGVVLVTGNVVLAAGQTTQSQNGPWSVNTAGAWTRPLDYPAAGTVIARLIEIESGALHAGEIWGSLQTTAVTIDTTATVWTTRGPTDLWFADTDTWVFVSANSFKIVGKDVIARFPLGTKCSYNDGAVDYGVVAKDAVISGSDTLVTLAANDDYAIANATLTAPRYSYAVTPKGFPSGFGWTPTLAGWSANPTNTYYRFGAVQGPLFWFVVRQGTAGTSNNATHSATLPSGFVSARTNTQSLGYACAGAQCSDGGAASFGGMVLGSAGTTLLLVGNLASATNTSSGTSRCIAGPLFGEMAAA